LKVFINDFQFISERINANKVAINNIAKFVKPRGIIANIPIVKKASSLIKGFIDLIIKITSNKIF
jgi:hypothetical protein